MARMYEGSEIHALADEGRDRLGVIFFGIAPAGEYPP